MAIGKTLRLRCQCRDGRCLYMEPQRNTKRAAEKAWLISLPSGVAEWVFGETPEAIAALKRLAAERFGGAESVCAMTTTRDWCEYVPKGAA